MQPIPFLTESFVSVPSGFAPYPAALLAGLSPQEVDWRVHLYARAFAQAQARAGHRVFQRAELGREARN
jgi:hypothetical protein